MANARRRFSVVAAGHADAISYHDDESSGAKRKLLKVLDENELAVYTRLQEQFPDDPVLEFLPRFEGVVVDTNDSGQDSKYICLENLLADFQQPVVMDIKLGIRTFTESESSKTTLRPDLYKRMEKMFPAEVTPDERAAEAITKHRWMTLRDMHSTSTNLGYRIDGVAGRSSNDALNAKLVEARTGADTLDILQEFVECAATSGGAGSEDQDLAMVVGRRLTHQLGRMLEAVQKSAFVRGHEFVGSSILLVADASGRTGVYWIDFAKTSLLPTGTDVTHCKPWTLGNHEDGIFMGIRKLRDNLAQVQMPLDLGKPQLECVTTAGGAMKRLQRVVETVAATTQFSAEKIVGPIVQVQGNVEIHASTLRFIRGALRSGKCVRRPYRTQWRTRSKMIDWCEAAWAHARRK